MRSRDPGTLELLEELQSACELPLFLGIIERPESQPKRSTWPKLIEKVSQLELTDEEYGLVLNCTSILLLGFLLPHSTGNGKMYDAAVDTVGRPLPVVKIPLEFRLEESVLYWDAGDVREFDSIVDSTTEIAFEDFIASLKLLLEARPAHTNCVDLWHLIAMAIHPLPAIEPLEKSEATVLTDSSDPLWKRARRLAIHPAAAQFKVHYGHRVKLLELLGSTVWPNLAEGDAHIDPTPLLVATTHLRASLRTFSAVSPSDWHLAEGAMVNLVSQIHELPLLREEWDFILQEMLEDHTPAVSLGGLSQDPRVSVAETCFCAHSARGRLLAKFILQSGRRRDNQQPDPFVQHTLGSLTDAIEWQRHSWIDVDERREGPEPLAPAVLSSLLYATKYLFYFRPAVPEELVESALLLLRHGDLGIVEQAADLLVQVFYFAPKGSISSFLPQLLASVNYALGREDVFAFLRRLVTLACRQSPAFAVSIYKLGSNGKEDTACVRSKLVATAATNCPTAIPEEALLLKSTSDPNHVAAILSLRQARVFVDDEYGKLLQETLEGSLDFNNWTIYQLARHSIHTGNFPAAKLFYAHLAAANVSRTRQHLWLKTLETVALCESSLCEDGESGLGSAAEYIQDAMSYLHYIQEGQQGIVTFQTQFLALRCDFFDLMALLRQVTVETKLMRQGPGRNTRSGRHLVGLQRGLSRLASNYRLLIRSNGMMFSSNASTPALRTLLRLVEFMKSVTEAVFADSIPPTNREGMEAGDTRTKVNGLLAGPMVSLLEKLGEIVVVPMDTSIEPEIRATAMLQVIKGVLTVPIPYPPDFFRLRCAEYVDVKLSTDPNPYSDVAPMSPDVVEAYPLSSFSFFASGVVPPSLYLYSKIPWYTVLLWCRIRSIDSHPHLDESPEMKIEVPQPPNFDFRAPAKCTLQPGGKFKIEVLSPPIKEEGNFVIDVRLGCQDVAGAQWELPVINRKLVMPLRVQRIR